METGAIILCGGKSSRMGRDKATLPFGPELMLQRVVRLLSEVIDERNLVVVAAVGQRLPALPNGVSVTYDQHQGRGPLEGMSAGLDAVPRGVEVVYTTSCDVPLLNPAFVSRMCELLGHYDIVVPTEGEQLHPLAAVYRSSISPIVHRLLQADRLRLQSLFAETLTRFIPTDELRVVDPNLGTLMNLNDPENYLAALKIAGFAAVGE